MICYNGDNCYVSLENCLTEGCSDEDLLCTWRDQFVRSYEADPTTSQTFLSEIKTNINISSVLIRTTACSNKSTNPKGVTSHFVYF